MRAAKSWRCFGNLRILSNLRGGFFSGEGDVLGNRGLLSGRGKGSVPSIGTTPS